jgi:hypothetical protein
MAAMHTNKTRGAGWLGEARIVGRLGLALAVFLVGYLLIYRLQQLRWGATDEEVARAMPGDAGVTGVWYGFLERN